MIRQKKHFIGFGLLLFMLTFFYTYSKVIFSFYNESSLLFEGIFVLVYLCFLIGLTLFYAKNNLIVENIVLAVFSFIFANPIVFELIYYPMYIIFKGSYALQTIDECFHVFTYPFDIFCSEIMFLIPFIPIIHLISMVIIFVKKHKKQK